MRKMMKRLAVAVVAALLLAVASPAVAFEPPSDPADVFSCDGGPVAGHPGSTGQKVAMEAGTMGAWNAHFSSTQIANCP